ncbi:uncharacterized protein LOC101845903 [Aplysia californica]|uniref:Uncharacterized protein LOC101845903 n=1 Tax=Aplysia californica TaxID=6500 RepID=A0ABM0JER0_APLCA|nr:uncharacterized protein LOC101845903 [Aplysia californica]
MAQKTQANAAVPRKQDFNRGHLGSNNFSIGHDFSVTKSTLQSVFKKDFPEHGTYGRADLAKPPRLGDVMHIDDRFNERASETVKAFEYQSIPKPVLLDVANKLSHTNFKMDSDTSKINSFHTTHNHFFKPKMGDTFSPLQQIQTTQVSSVPQGDREKAEKPISDYKYKFTGIDTTKNRVERARCMHDDGPPTIKGDNRLGHFTSVSRTQFQGDWAPKVPILPVPPSYNVPVGDPDKEKTKWSVMQSSYDDYTDALKSHTPFDTQGVSSKLRKTNYKERDGHGVWDSYETTMTSAFPAKTVDLSRSSPSKHRNESDFPPGDREAIRDKERMSLTTSRFYHGSPALGLHNRIVSGANRRTQSNVWFGDPDLDKRYYSTSTKEVFQPKRVPYSYDRQSHYIPSSIPIDYCRNSMTYEATTSTDFPDPRQERMVPNAKALESLQSSHIKPPQKHMTFNTTHQDEFVPKPLQNFVYDSGRLQRSSVPLGTMAI